MTSEPSAPAEAPTEGDEAIAAETNYAKTETEAEVRSARYRDKDVDIDPFPDIPRSLLSSEHIKAYVRQTGMIHPFVDRNDRLKSASYEVNAGGQFIYWDENGNKISVRVEKDGIITLPPNSISFIQLESTFRLPQYIAVRFNLRITHVHRGLLLGTGPLVDPGFHGSLLIPLHNLTSDPYTIRGDEGLIWIEFTKTSHLAEGRALAQAPEYKFDRTEARKNDQPPEYYFDRASKNRPIRSSIPLVVSEARKLAENASKAAERAEWTNKIFVGAGVLAIVGVVVGIFSFLETVKSNVMSALNLAATVSVTATQAASDAKRLQDDFKDLKVQFDSADGKRSADELQRIRNQLDETRGQIQALRAQTERLSDELRARSSSQSDSPQIAPR
jgi:deoxycytidine triphosphate deaminase